MSEPEQQSLGSGIGDLVAGGVLMVVGNATDGSALARALRTWTWPSVELDLVFDLVALGLLLTGGSAIVRWFARRRAVTAG